MNPTTIYKALNPADAQLVFSRLEAAALGMEGYALAVGGIRVQVPESEATDAMEFLAAPTE